MNRRLTLTALLLSSGTVLSTADAAPGAWRGTIYMVAADYTPNFPGVYGRVAEHPMCSALQEGIQTVAGVNVVGPGGCLGAPPPPPSGAAPPTCKGIPATIVGTSGNDVLSGTPGRDVTVGLTGNDKLSGLAGNDLICGGYGADRLHGGSGNDSLAGEQGGKVHTDHGWRISNDVLFGDAGDDFFSPGYDGRYPSDTPDRITDGGGTGQRSAAPRPCSSRLCASRSRNSWVSRGSEDADRSRGLSSRRAVSWSPAKSNFASTATTWLAGWLSSTPVAGAGSAAANGARVRAVAVAVAAAMIRVRIA